MRWIFYIASDPFGLFFFSLFLFTGMSSYYKRIFRIECCCYCCRWVVWCSHFERMFGMWLQGIQIMIYIVENNIFSCNYYAFLSIIIKECSGKEKQRSSRRKIWVETKKIDFSRLFHYEICIRWVFHGKSPSINMIYVTSILAYMTHTITSTRIIRKFLIL